MINNKSVSLFGSWQWDRARLITYDAQPPRMYFHIGIEKSFYFWLFERGFLCVACLCLPSAWIKGMRHWTREMAQMLSALAALPEDLSSISSTYTVAHNHA